MRKATAGRRAVAVECAECESQAPPNGGATSQRCGLRAWRELSLPPHPPPVKRPSPVSSCLLPRPGHASAYTTVTDTLSCCVPGEIGTVAALPAAEAAGLAKGNGWARL
jgi:hypothetical protein